MNERDSVIEAMAVALFRVEVAPVQMSESMSEVEYRQHHEYWRTAACAAYEASPLERFREALEEIAALIDYDPNGERMKKRATRIAERALDGQRPE